MEKKKLRVRLLIILSLFALCLTAFLYVLYHLQIVEGAEFLEQTRRKIADVESVEAARGNIYDRNGTVMATNRTEYQVTLKTKLMGESDRRNGILLELLRLTEEHGVAHNDSLPISVPTAGQKCVYTVETPFETQLVKKDGSIVKANSRLFEYLKKIKGKKFAFDENELPDATDLLLSLEEYYGISQEISARDARLLAGVLYEEGLREKDVSRIGYVFAVGVDIGFITAVKEHNLTGVRMEAVQTRDYRTELAPHLLGQVGAITAENWDYYREKGYAMDEVVGGNGFEQAFEDILHGKAGRRDVTLNQNGKILEEQWHRDGETGEEEIPVPGLSVTVTLDLNLQDACERALAHYVPELTEETEGAAAVVMDMYGGILATASYPTFSHASYRKDFGELMQDPLSPLLNRALQGLYAPGSTFKPVVAAGALQEGAITVREKILDTGRYKHFKRIEDQPMCWLYRQYGGTHGYETVSDAIRDSCNVFFYETGLRLGIEKIDDYAARFGLGEKTGVELYEERGSVAGPATSEELGQKWYEGDTMYAAIGQGNTRVTPLQLCNYTATLVNGGHCYAAHYLLSTRDETSGVTETVQPTLRHDVTLDDSTVNAIKKGMKQAAESGTLAYVFRELPVEVGAKTGSAQVGADREANGLLIAFAPYENPEVAVCVVAEHGGSGSATANIAADILKAYFDPTNPVIYEIPEADDDNT